jgi:acyl phosphate:glycerol-3-phosphate acyltransferase
VVVTALAVLAAYLVGAVPVGYLVAKAFGVHDIRRQGSGNIGATNVMRTLGRMPGILTLLGDIGKGYGAVAAGAAIADGARGVTAACAAAAVIGNCWSIFLGFRGGKGVATGLGAFLRLVPWAAVAAVPAFLVVAATTRYVSLASLLAACLVPVGAFALGYPTASVIACVAVAAIVVLRHRDNIARLASGSEHRLGGRSGAA